MQLLYKFNNYIIAVKYYDLIQPIIDTCLFNCINSSMTQILHDTKYI